MKVINFFGPALFFAPFGVIPWPFFSPHGGGGGRSVGALAILLRMIGSLYISVGRKCFKKNVEEEYLTVGGSLY